MCERSGSLKLKHLKIRHKAKKDPLIIKESLAG